VDVCIAVGEIAVEVALGIMDGVRDPSGVRVSVRNNVGVRVSTGVGVSSIVDVTVNSGVGVSVSVAETSGVTFWSTVLEDKCAGTLVDPLEPYELTNEAEDELSCTILDADNAATVVGASALNNITTIKEMRSVRSVLGIDENITSPI
jgi:hypothetical protein